MRRVTLLIGLASVLLVPSSCFFPGPSHLDYQSGSALIRLDEHRFGILVNPCSRGRVSSVTLYLSEYPGRGATPVLTEVFAAPVDLKSVMVTTGVDDPPSVKRAVRTVHDPESLERFNSDEQFLVTTPNGVGVPYADLIAPDETGVSRGYGIDRAAELRFETEIGMVTESSYALSDPIDTYTCPRDGELAWDPALGPAEVSTTS